MAKRKRMSKVSADFASGMIREELAETMKDLKEFRSRRGWAALGYESWRDYWKAELEGPFGSTSDLLGLRSGDFFEGPWIRDEGDFEVSIGVRVVGDAVTKPSPPGSSDAAPSGLTPALILEVLEKIQWGGADGTCPSCGADGHWLDPALHPKAGHHETTCALGYLISLLRSGERNR